MSLRQILVLAFALLAALGALVLVRGAANQPKPVAKPAAVTALGPMVLVAAKPIEAGTLASAEQLAWAMWPREAVTDAFIQQTGPGDTNLQDFVGAVAKIDILQGEPITPTRLIKKGQSGFFAAMLEPGYRAVALPISEGRAAAGFIMPGDRVDILLTRKMEARGSRGDEVRSDVVLQDVQVLAMGPLLRDPSTPGETPTPHDEKVATLALTARDAEILAMADELGDVSLVLRGLADEPAFVTAESARRAGARVLQQVLPPRDGVRIHAFGTVAEAQPAQNPLVAP